MPSVDLHDSQGEPSILVGVDGSDDGLRAVRYAATAAKLTHGTLRMVHAVDDAVLAGAWGVVYDPTILQSAGEQANEQALTVVDEVGLARDRVHAEVVLGNASAILTRLSEESSLLVVGRRSVSGLERMFVGSTSVSVAGAAHCPVIVISAASTPEPTGTKGAIAVGVDSTFASMATLEWACEEAAARDVRLEILHISQPVPTGLFGRDRSSAETRKEQVEAARTGVDAMVAPMTKKFPDLRMEVQVGYGNPVDVLVDCSERVDLLILGVQKPNSVGGVVRGVLAHASAPLCLVK